MRLEVTKHFYKFTTQVMQPVCELTVMWWAIVYLVRGGFI